MSLYEVRTTPSHSLATYSHILAAPSTGFSYRLPVYFQKVSRASCATVGFKAVEHLGGGAHGSDDTVAILDGLEGELEAEAGVSAGGVPNSGHCV